MTQDELNAQLLDVCLADEVDYARAEELLRQGAEPLGKVMQWGFSPENLYSAVFDELDTGDGMPEDLYKITELFLRYGMDIAKPSIPYGDYDNDVIENPLWSFAFSSNEVVLRTLKLLLDHGLSAADAAECWEHASTELWLFGKDNEEECDHAVSIEYARKIMLIASYPHVLNADKNLRREIWYDSNHYDLTRLRNWDDFAFSARIHPCDVYTDTYCSVITITEKSTGKAVWQFGAELHT